MKKLGFGLMRLPLLDPKNNKSIDIEQTKKMVDTFLERGFTYFDTAWMYCGFESENAIREALVERHPRDSYTLADKLHSAFIKTREDRDLVFEEQRRKTGVEYFDYYLIHDVTREHCEVYDALDCFTWVADKKAAGQIKHVGFSFHGDAIFLEEFLTAHKGLFEFVQLQINYLDWESDRVQSRLCYEVARKHNMPIIVMEPVKGGTLAKVPEAVETMFRAYHEDWSAPSWAVRFAAGLEGVMMVLSGMSNMEQLLDNTDYMADFKPLTETELKIVRTAADMIREKIAIPCTGCSYCTGDCPMGIDIPSFFSLYNADMRGEEGAREEYEKRAVKYGNPSTCIGCGQCEDICPQHLPIISDLQKIREHFGK